MPRTPRRDQRSLSCASDVQSPVSHARILAGGRATLGDTNSAGPNPLSWTPTITARVVGSAWHPETRCRLSGAPESPGSMTAQQPADVLRIGTVLRPGRDRRRGCPRRHAVPPCPRASSSATTAASREARRRVAVFRSASAGASSATGAARSVVAQSATTTRSPPGGVTSRGSRPRLTAAGLRDEPGSARSGRSARRMTPSVPIRKP